MPWTYEDNPTSNIVEVTYSGEVTAHDLQESTSRLIALQKETGRMRFLVDTTEMKFSASIVDLHEIPTKQYRDEGADRRGRVAVIHSTSPKEKEAVEFFEVVCRNSGWMVSVFAERQPAVDWLLLD